MQTYKKKRYRPLGQYLLDFILYQLFLAASLLGTRLLGASFISASFISTFLFTALLLTKSLLNAFVGLGVKNVKLFGAKSADKNL
jgi:hypothetical protein